MTFDNMFDSIDNEFGIVEEAPSSIDNEFGLNDTEVVEEEAIRSYDSRNARVNFERAFANEHYKVSYDEVAPLVTTSLVSHMIHYEATDNRNSIAGCLLDIFGETIKDFVAKEHWSAKKIARVKARHEEKLAKREVFMAKWEALLGYIGGHVEVTQDFVNEANSKVAENPFFANVEFCANYELVDGLPKHFGSKNNRKVLLPSDGLPPVNNLGELILAIMIHACRELTAEQKVELVVDLDGLTRNPKIELTGSGTGVIIEDFMFDLGDATITRIVKDGPNISKGRCQKTIKAVMISRFFVIDGCDAVFMWMLNAMRMTSKTLAQAVNMSSNFFKQEINYGMKYSPLDIGFHVYENMLKQAKIECANSVYFPYSNLSNAKLGTDTLSFVLSRGVPATCDKQNKSWIVMNSGVQALFLGFDEEGYIINLNDSSKATKLFNRPASCVYQMAEIL